MHYEENRDVEETYLISGDAPERKNKKKWSKCLNVTTLILVPIILGMVVIFSITLVLLIIVNNINNRGSEMRFIAFGDWGRKGEYTQEKVAVSMNRWCQNSNGCNFMISTGDNFYPSGVETEHATDFQESFVDIYLTKTYLEKLTYYLCLGNHDYKKNPYAEINYGKTHENWVMPGTFYTRDVKSDDRSSTLRMVFVDTVPLIDRYYDPDVNVNHTALNQQNATEQLQWFDKTLEKATQDGIFTIVIGHHPLHALTDKSEEELTNLHDKIQSIMLKYNIAIYVAGHVHNLQYSSVDGEGIKIFNILSGAGSKLAELPRDNEVNMPIEKTYSKFSYDKEGGFVAFILEKQKLTATWISHDYQEKFKRSFVFDPMAKDSSRYTEMEEEI